MTFTGLTYRYFTALQQLSFVFQNFQVNALNIYSGGNPNIESGQYVRLGFTGIHTNTGWAFTLKNGKMYDPEGRCFGGYNDFDIFTLSGNTSTGNYNYYLNNVLICSIGTKSNFDVNGWFVECNSGASATGNVLIYGPTIPCSLVFDTGFLVGGQWTGRFTHTNTGPIVLRSGVLSLSDGSQFSLNTGFNFLGGTNVIPSGGTATGILTHTGTQETTGTYLVGVDIYTDFGPLYFIATGGSSFGSSGTVSNSFLPSGQTDLPSTNHLSSGTGTWYFFTNSSDYTGGLQSVPFYVSLNYTLGYTGQFSLLTGFIITNSGSGYSSQPKVLIYTVAPNQIVSGYPTFTGSGLISGSGLTGIRFFNTGIYTGNTGNYKMVISGGNPTLTGSAVPLFGFSYNKTFISGFNLITGFLGTSGALAARSTTLYSGSGNMTPPNTAVFLQVTYSGTYDTTGIMVTINASGLPDSSGFSLFSGSGLGYTINTL